ncbi:MAG: DUF167 domain-containing protein [Phycisphaerales bacterium]|jgi:hypothetical protein|nr:DUF167 domain-containing protein [Phycisphaerales bacterium]
MPLMTGPWVADGADTLIRIKAVPGASRDAVAGLLGDRLKVRVSAAPEGGKANKAICQLLSITMGCPVAIESGHRSPLKMIRAIGFSPTQVAEALGL